MDLVMSYLPPAVEDEEDAEQYGYDEDGYAVEQPAAPPAAPAAPAARRPRAAHDDDDEDGQPW
jgi:hypothetical protein